MLGEELIFSGPDLWVNAFWESGPAKDLVFGWLTSEAMLERMIAFGLGDTGDIGRRNVAMQIAEIILRWREAMGQGDGAPQE